jgi:hypothetical protein
MLFPHNNSAISILSPIAPIKTIRYAIIVFSANMLKLASICKSIADFKLQLNHHSSGIVGEYFKTQLVVTTESKIIQDIRINVDKKVLPGKVFFLDFFSYFEKNCKNLFYSY